ncbi:MAG TPA: terminase small subunit [Steroidobacteraceae bacterium]
MTSNQTEPASSAYRKLSKRLKRFVDAYVELGVGTKAIRKIGFEGKRPDVAASKLLARPNIRAAIAERDELAAVNAGITRTLILTQLRHIATFDHRDLYDEKGNPLPVSQLPEEVAAGLASSEVEELFEGRGESRERVGRLHKYRSWSKPEALRLLAQIRKMPVERHELAGPNGGPIEHRDVDSLTDAELEAIARRGRPGTTQTEAGALTDAELEGIARRGVSGAAESQEISLLTDAELEAIARGSVPTRTEPEEGED